jgi:putative ABC transport system substrate-binding protein
MLDLRRRQFLTLLGGGAAAWPLAARAERSAKLPTIGYLGSSTASAQSQWVAAFVQRLNDHGWIEGRTITVQYRWAEGRIERFQEIASEFARLKVDIIVTAGCPYRKSQPLASKDESGDGLARCGPAAE